MKKEAIPRYQYYYTKLHDKCGKVLQESVSLKTKGKLSKCHHFIFDLNEWETILSERPEVVLFKEASREYEVALLSLLFGLYRQAFMGLRFFIEHSLAGVYFSANELELRTWLRGDRDIYWASLIDQDKGVFSHPFVKAFNEDLLEEAPSYRTITEKLYRECSEHVHGNFLTQQKMPRTINFNDEIFNEWTEKADSARLIFTYVLSMRYLKFIDKDGQNDLEHIIMDTIGHIKGIRKNFGAPLET